jgi:integrase
METELNKYCRENILLTRDFRSDKLTLDSITGGFAMRGTINEYRTGKWRVIIYWKGRRYYFYKYRGGTPLVHRKLAERLIEHINYLIDHHKFDPSAWQKDSPFRFEKAVEIWINLSKCSPEWKTKRCSIAQKILIPFWGGHDIRDIRRIQIDDFVIHLKQKGYSEKYIYNILGELKALLNFHRDSIPQMVSFPTISFQEAPIRWLSAKQQDEIFEFIPERNLPIFTFMRWTGCRPNEACGLLRENVFLKTDPPYLLLATVIGKYGLKANTKTRKLKPLPIIPEIEWTLKPKSLGRFVFMKRGEPYTQRMLRYVWEKANKKANEVYGTPMINLYNGLKHSFGCQRINAGISLDAIRAIMGHTDSRTTERYAKYAVEKLAPAMRGQRCVNLVQTQ